MNDYISREDVQGQIVKAAEKCQIKLFDKSVNVILQILQNMPAADVQPVRRGCWELTGNPSFRKCSECGAWWSSDITDNCFTKYCPKCGARMDGDTNG